MVKFIYSKEEVGLYKDGILDSNGVIINEVYLTELKSNIKKFYERDSWAKMSDLVLSHYSNKCQLNGKECTTVATLVHHIELLTDRPDLAFAVYNGNDRQLVALCQKCHTSIHTAIEGEVINEELNNSLK